ncbi:MAG: Two component signal transduction histidine kinase [Frankiales bacterium]|nr:Two component signal transduction histidine kinase [Frankiales bacterium]
MSDILWAHRPQPRLGSEAVVLLRARPDTAAELTALRLRLQAALLDDAQPAGVDSGAVDGLLLVFEELVSNGLRHGHGPIHVSVTDMRTGWLLEVSDDDPDHAPTPAVGRDAAEGGLGLVLVARLSGSHGWAVDGGGRKTVWACVEYAAATVVSTVPAPRAPVVADGREPDPAAASLTSDAGG